MPPIPSPPEREEYPLPPQGGMQIFVRAFAPFKTFGGGYEGDNRQFTTDTSVTAKIRWVFTFDVAMMRQVDKADTESSPSYGEGWFPSIMAYTAPFSAKFQHDGKVGGKADSKGSQVIESVGRPGTGFVLTGDLAGANPLVGGAADIDVQVSIKAIKREGKIEFSGNLTGDAFPNAEVFIRDAAGDAFMLHTFETTGTAATGPYAFLPGHNHRPMGSFAKSVKVSAIGLIDE